MLIVAIICIIAWFGFPNISPVAEFTNGHANIPVAISPHIPAHPCTPNTSNASS